MKLTKSALSSRVNFLSTTMREEGNGIGPGNVQPIKYMYYYVLRQNNQRLQPLQELKFVIQFIFCGNIMTSGNIFLNLLTST